MTRRRAQISSTRTYKIAVAFGARGCRQLHKHANICSENFLKPRAHVSIAKCTAFFSSSSTSSASQSPTIFGIFSTSRTNAQFQSPPPLPTATPQCLSPRLKQSQSLNFRRAIKLNARRQTAAAVAFLFARLRQASSRVNAERALIVFCVIWICV